MAYPPGITREDWEAGFRRCDPEDGTKLREGQMTGAETRAFLARMRASWQRKFMGPEPPAEGSWTWTTLHGWCRRGEPRPAKKARA